MRQSRRTYESGSRPKCSSKVFNVPIRDWYARSAAASALGSPGAVFIPKLPKVSRKFSCPPQAFTKASSIDARANQRAFMQVSVVRNEVVEQSIPHSRGHRLYWSTCEHAVTACSEALWCHRVYCPNTHNKNRGVCLGREVCRRETAGTENTRKTLEEMRKNTTR